MTEIIYPGVSQRVKASITDAVILVLFMFMFGFVFSLFDHVPNYLRISAFTFIFLLYDPLTTCFMGGTFGHKSVGICVKKEADPNKNISFLQALVRYVIKSLLGWISLLVVLNNEKRQAIHDLAVHSVVLYERKH
jgi:uncharacterized RDD family membrane protein YckC